MHLNEFPKNAISIDSQGLFCLLGSDCCMNSSFQVGFLQSIIRPFIYIGTDEELNTAKKSNQVKKFM